MSVKSSRSPNGLLSSRGARKLTSRPFRYDDDYPTRKLILIRLRSFYYSYPIVYLFPMFGLTGNTAIVAIQLGYSVADIVAKCVVGLLIFNITAAKSIALKSGHSEEAPLYGSSA